MVGNFQDLPGIPVGSQDCQLLDLESTSYPIPTGEPFYPLYPGMETILTLNLTIYEVQLSQTKPNV